MAITLNLSILSVPAIPSIPAIASIPAPIPNVFGPEYGTLYELASILRHGTLV